MARLLYLSFEADGMRPLPAREEAAELRRMLAGRVEVIEAHDVTVAQLPGLLTQHKPQIVHWTGHGTPDNELLARRSPAERHLGNERLSAQHLTELLRALADQGRLGARLLVLNACFGRVVASAVREVVPCVIGWDDAVLSELARAYSAALYEQLAQGCSVAEAHAVGSRVVAAKDPDTLRRFGLEHRDEVQPMDITIAGGGQEVQVAPLPRPSAEPVARCEIVLMLDVYTTNPRLRAEIEEMPDAPGVDARWIQYTADAHAPRLDAGPVGPEKDWAHMARRAAEMVQRFRELHARAGLPVRLFVAGQAPFALFSLVGHLISRFKIEVVFLHLFDKQGWQRMTLTPETTATETYFSEVSGFDLSRWQGDGQRLAVYLQVSRLPFKDQDGLRKTIQGVMDPTGESWVDIAWLVNLAGRDMDDQNFNAIANEIVQHLGGLGVVAQGLQELWLCLNVPAPVAFLVGWAINPNQIPRLVLTQYLRPTYHPVIQIPLPERVPPRIDQTPEAATERGRLRLRFQQVLGRLQAQITVDDLRMPDLLGGDSTETEAAATALRDRLGRLQLQLDPAASPGFWLSTLTDEIALGEGFLEALRFVSPERVETLMELFILHELFHEQQGLASETYEGIGRAAVVLGELDDVADSFAIRALMACRFRRGGVAEEEASSARLCASLDAHLEGMRAFDRLEQGPRLVDLPERRLRRYLRWALLRARAAGVRRAAQVVPLLSQRLLVEMVPMDGRLDERTRDKLVKGKREDTELVIVIGRALIRVSQGRTFKPEEVLKHVLELDMDALWRSLTTVVVEHRAHLQP